MLHCSVGPATGHEPYAPCELSDLVDRHDKPSHGSGRGFDYWALGHVHEKAILNSGPHVVYPGNTQGRHFRETGERGCFVVTVEDGEARQIEFCPLDRVRWLETSLSISDVSTLDGLERAIVDTVQGLAGASGGRALVCRLTVGGRGSLYRELRKPGNVTDLVERARESFRGDAPFVWLQEILVDCRPETDIPRRKEAGDFLAEVLSIAEEIVKSPEKMEGFAHGALSELLRNRQFEKGIGAFPPEQIAAMMKEAELICLDKLETEE